MRGIGLAALGALLLLAGGARAQDSAVTVAPHLPANAPQWAVPQQAPPAQIPGTLRLPPGNARIPMVVILHGSGGVDGRGEAYARALLAAGIGSLELDMWRPRGIGTGQGVQHRPRVPDTLPDVFGALRFLAQHPRVDPQRIGVMGMSYGAQLSLLAATDPVGRVYGAGGPDFRAALPIYPPCWAWDAQGPYARFVTPNFPRLPLLLLAGEQDDYDADGGASCRRLVAAGGPPGRARAAIHVYPGATHGWETQRPMTYRDPGANRGQGGNVRLQRDPATTADGTRRAVAFFQASLTPR
jgi:dienelactone hydrolase